MGGPPANLTGRQLSEWVAAGYLVGGPVSRAEAVEKQRILYSGEGGGGE